MTDLHNYSPISDLLYNFECPIREHRMENVLYGNNDNNWLWEPAQCPGFCGRLLNTTQNAQTCQACPWGFRSDKNSICERCTTPLRAYDYCFLIFHALIPVLVNGLFLKIYASHRIGVRTLQRRKLWIFAQGISVLLESILALFLTVLLIEPRSSFLVFGCAKRIALKDWYPMLYNPIVNYTKTLQCSHELVYPLYSMPFILIALCLINLLIFRSLLYILARVVFRVHLHSGTYYAALWVLPLTAFFHSFMSGVIYFVFPHLCVISSLALNAAHLAVEGRQTVRKMFALIFSLAHVEHLLLILAHMMLFGFGVISIMLAGGTAARTLTPIHVAALLAILPVPTCFYVLTIRLTTPIRAMRYRR